MKTFFNIALSGLSEADVKQVLAALESPGLDKWALSEGGNSDLLLIDVDSVWGHMDWLRAHSEGRLCAAYTAQDSIRDCTLLLQKPLDTDNLTALLRQVQTGQVAHAQTPDRTAAAPAPEPAPVPESEAAPEPAPVAVPAPEPAPPEPIVTARAPEPASPPPEAQAAPAASISAGPVSPQTVGALLLSGGISENVLIEGQGDIRLAIVPASNSYHAPPQLKPIEKLLDAPVSCIRPVDIDDPEVQHAGPQQPLIRLLWFAALCASDGKLAPHLDPDATWQLTRWPQIEREFPRHFRIATAMMKQAGTLQDVAEAAKSPIEDVASFINAYYVAGYVAPEGSDEPVELASTTANVFSRLRGTLLRGSRPA